MKITDTGQFQSGLLDMINGYSRLLDSDRRKSRKPGDELFHEASERHELTQEFFACLSDLLQVTATMPFPYSLGLNGNPDLWLAALPQRPFQWGWARVEEPAGQGLEQIWNSRVGERLRLRGIDDLENAVTVVAVFRHPEELSMEFFDETLGVIGAGLSVGDVLSEIADQVWGEGDDDSPPRRRRLVGFGVDERLRGRLRISAWAFQESVRMIR